MDNARLCVRMAPVGAVHPLEGSYVDQKMRKNAKWLLSLKPERLVAPLRAQCGLPVGDAKPYGGWKDYYYYYLRSVINLYTAFRGVDGAIAEEAAQRARKIVSALIECQQKTAETCPEGMITPEMEKQFVDRTHFVRDSVYSHTHIEAVLYTVHKVMYGLIYASQALEMPEALAAAEKMARRVHDGMAPLTPEERIRMTDSRRVEDFFSEAGGIMDAFLWLYELTGDAVHLETADFLRRPWFDRMFTEDDDRLGWGMEHANSEIPYVEALAHRYQLTGDASALNAARGFMRASVEAHELPQGSVSGRSAFPDYQSELYNYPRRVFFHIMDTPARKNISSGESCCAHNLNRVCRRLIEISPEAWLMDAWDRRFVNAVLAQQNPDTGMFIYNLNLKENAYKMWGYPDKSFWCCYGTGAEVFSSLTEGAFFESDDAAYACLYMPCTYTHAATGVRIVERTNYPDDGRIEFTFETGGELGLFVRLPAWLSAPAKLTLPDGEEVEVDRPGTLYEVRRNWRAGDVLRLELPFGLRYACMPDRPEYISVTYGPNLEVLCAPGKQLFSGTARALLDALEPTGAPCTFAADFQSEEAGGTHIVKPVRAVCDETYSGYFHLTEAPEEIVCDAIELGSEESRRAHGLEGVGLQLGSFCGHPTLATTLTFFSDPGEVRFEMEADPDRELMLRLYLDGSARAYIHQFSGHVVNPLFDLEVRCGDEWRPFSTKSMEADYPGEIYYENFVIPRAWTSGKSRLQFRIAARNFHEIPGVIETLVDRIQLVAVPETSGLRRPEDARGAQAEKVYMPNALGL